jgi:hypothetical protein
MRGKNDALALPLASKSMRGNDALLVATIFT